MDLRSRLYEEPVIVAFVRRRLERRRPTRAATLAAPVHARRVFDSEWYSARCGPLPDGADPFDDYVERGWRLGRRPSPVFEPEGFNQPRLESTEAVDPHTSSS